MHRFCVKRKRCLFCLTLCAFLFMCLLSSPTIFLPTGCSSTESLNSLQILCHQYKDKVLTGNMCRGLCDTKTLIFDRCLNYHGGKEVYLMRWNGIHVVLKSKVAHFNDYPFIGALRKHNQRRTTNATQTALSDEDFSNLLESSINSISGIKPKFTGFGLLSHMWIGDIAKYRKNGDKHDISFMQSLWSLVQQEEYIMLQYFKSIKHLPNILGSCGHFYALEYLPPGDQLAPGLLEVVHLHQTGWKQRAATAVALLDAIRSLDTEFYEPLQMCDMKGNNFGIAADNSIRIIDVDMLMFNTRLTTDFAATKCNDNSDCDFFDCRGWCDIPNGQCLNYRINNNLQALCEKVFANHNINGYRGLLYSPPIKYRTEIQGALKHCIQPLPSQDSPRCSTNDCFHNTQTYRFSAQDDVLEELLISLMESVKERNFH